MLRKFCAALLLLGIAGCSFLPESQRQEFTVAGERAGDPAPFHNHDPELTARLAGQICADEHETMGTATLPSTGRPYDQLRLRCEDAGWDPLGWMIRQVS